MKTQDQQALRIYIRAREDVQALRKRMDNRLGMKADGTQQKVQDERSYSIEDAENFRYLSESARQVEKDCEKMLKKILKRFAIYNEWLLLIKGVGPVSAGYLLSEFDIEKATTVSKMWQYSGMNPGVRMGKKRVSKKSYKESMGQIVEEKPNIKTGELDYIIQTDDLIRGDRRLEGYVSPYNKNLKTHLLGVMADGFIKQQNSYALEYYYPYKLRKENSEAIIMNEGKERKDDGKKWNEVSKGHRDSAAKRYMVKMFLIDFYVAWRTIEGLPVREPYSEEYLGKKHSA